MTRSRKETQLLATAAWTDLQGQTIGFMGAAMRAATPTELQAMRQRAHDTLDAVLDLNAEAGQQVRLDALD